MRSTDSDILDDAYDEGWSYEHALAVAAAALRTTGHRQAPRADEMYDACGVLARLLGRLVGAAEIAQVSTTDLDAATEFASICQHVTQAMEAANRAHSALGREARGET